MLSSKPNTFKDTLIDRREHADTSSLPSSHAQLQAAGHRMQSFDILAILALEPGLKKIS